MTTQRPRPFRLTQGTYRNVNGWFITGGPGVFPVSIFMEHESAARRTIGVLRSVPHYQTTVADFEPDIEVALV